MRQLGLGGFDAPAHGEVHRLFFALWPDQATRAGIQQAAAQLQAAHAPRGRWLGAHRYHLTLQYLGDFDALPPALVEAALAAAGGVRAAAFELVLDQAGSFRNRAIPWWLGSVAPPAGLQALWDGLGVALAKAGVRVHSASKLVPHVTVLRDASTSLPQTPIDPVPWPVRDFALIHSVLGAQSGYRLLGRWPLQGG